MRDRFEHSTSSERPSSNDRPVIAHEAEFYADLERDTGADDSAEADASGACDATLEPSSQPPRGMGADARLLPRVGPSTLRRAAAPIVLASALAIGALAHGAVADKLRPAKSDPATDHTAIAFPTGGAWRRIPSLDGEMAGLDATEKANSLIEPEATAVVAPPAMDTSAAVPAYTPWPSPAADPSFLPMAYDAICALPIVTAVYVAPVGQDGPDAPPVPAATPVPAALDIRSLAVAWPMLEPWSHLPGDPLPIGPNAHTKPTRKSMQAGAVAAAKPTPEDQEPEQAPRPRPKPAAAAVPAWSLSGTPNTALSKTFDLVAKESP